MSDMSDVLDVISGIIFAADNMPGHRDRCTPLGESFESLEGIVDENPVLIPGRVGRRTVTGRVVVDVVLVMPVCCRKFKIDVRKVVKVRRVVDGLDLDGDGCRPLTDMLPIHALAEET